MEASHRAVNWMILAELWYRGFGDPQLMFSSVTYMSLFIIDSVKSVDKLSITWLTRSTIRRNMEWIRKTQVIHLLRSWEFDITVDLSERKPKEVNSPDTSILYFTTFKYNLFITVDINIGGWGGRMVQGDNRTCTALSCSHNKLANNKWTNGSFFCLQIKWWNFHNLLPFLLLILHRWLTDVETQNCLLVITNFMGITAHSFHKHIPIYLYLWLVWQCLYTVFFFQTILHTREGLFDLIYQLLMYHETERSWRQSWIRTGSLSMILLWVGDECSNIAYANNEESDGLEE